MRSSVKYWFFGQQLPQPTHPTTSMCMWQLWSKIEKRFGPKRNENSFYRWLGQTDSKMTGPYLRPSMARNIIMLDADHHYRSRSPQMEGHFHWANDLPLELFYKYQKIIIGTASCELRCWFNSFFFYLDSFNIQLGIGTRIGIGWLVGYIHAYLNSHVNESDRRTKLNQLRSWEGKKTF